MPDSDFTLGLAVLVAVFGVARLGRIATYDDYPPAEWLRMRWLALVGEKWGKLALCPWCLNPYLMAGCMAWAWFSDFHWTWWAFWTWLALAQVATSISAYDEPPEA